MSRGSSDGASGVYMEETDFGYGVQTILGQQQHFFSIDYDHRAEAQAAMRWAVAATCERERLEWVRVALAWQDLALMKARAPEKQSEAPRLVPMP